MTFKPLLHCLVNVDDLVNSGKVIEMLSTSDKIEHFKVSKENKFSDSLHQIESANHKKTMLEGEGKQGTGKG